MPNRRIFCVPVVLLLLAFGAWSAPRLTADETNSPAAPAAEGAGAEPESADADAGKKPLATDQDLISRRYKRFEETLVKVAESMRKTDPDRANLLIRAIGKSKEDRIAVQMTQLVELLEREQLGDAFEQQQELVTQLQALLNLLLSEDRAKERAEEKARLEAYIKELNKIIAQEKDVRASTERGESGEKLAERQGKIAEKAADLGKKIDQDDAAKRAKEAAEGGGDEGKPGEGKPGEGKPGEGKPGEGKPGEGKPGEGKPGEGKPGEGKPGEGKPGEGKPGEGKPGEGKPGEGKPGEGQPGEGQPGEGQPGEGKPGEGKPGEGKPGKATPGRENIEQARREMEKAIEKLKQQKHQDASDHQDEAIRELAKAKEKLEEILRQLREEERERLLAALEARFQKMLAMQLVVYDGTQKLDKTPAAERGSRVAGRSLQLARQEEEIALEATKAITLLREEGTAVAFPEAVEQMRDDMRIVVGRLERADVGELTQAIEKDIIEALEEMIEALQKEMEKKDKEESPPGQPKDQPPQDPALVDQLAELKMLRSLQLRVNHRTKRLGQLIEGEQAEAPDLVQQLQNLSERQARIQQATYDLATGKNK